MNRILIGTLLSIGLAAGLSAQPQPQNQQSGLLRQLATCQAQSGQMMMTIADVNDGKLIEPAKIVEAIQKANPTFDIDAKTLQITVKATK